MRLTWLETLANHLIILIAGALLLCGLLLLALHLTRAVSNIRVKKMREKLLCLLSGEADARRMKTKLYEMLQPGGEVNRLSDIRGIRSLRGLRVIAETADEVSGEAWQKLAAETGGEWYGAYLKRRLDRSNQEAILLVVRLIGSLRIQRFTQNVVAQIYYYRAETQMQHICMLALCMLGAEREVVALCRDQSIASLLSFRTLEEVFSTYAGDRKILCRKLITTAADQYIRRTCIKAIGENEYTELGDLVVPFLKSSQLNARIDAVRTLGQLRVRTGFHQVLALSEDMRWEMRAVVATALGAYGATENVDVLIRLLCDREWWVRYRAAEALLKYPRRDALLARLEETNDRFAQEMMRFALEKDAFTRGEAAG